MFRWNILTALALALASNPAVADDKRDYIKKLAPEVVGGYSLDELYKAHPDAKKGVLTRNPDGSQELLWGDNLANGHAALGDGKVLMCRRKVIRLSKEAAERAALAPVATLGKPKSTGVPDDEPDTVSCNVWVVDKLWVRTAVVRGKTVTDTDVFFTEISVIDMDAVDRSRKK